MALLIKRKGATQRSNVNLEYFKKDGERYISMMVGDSIVQFTFLEWQHVNHKAQALINEHNPKETLPLAFTPHGASEVREHIDQQREAVLGPSPWSRK
jgi:hypothetical protein